MERLNETAQDWVPHVRRLRPDLAWEDVVRIINGPLPEARRWTQSRLLRAVKAYVGDGFLPAEVLARAGRRETDDRLPAIVAGIKGADPRHHASGDLHPAGSDARTHASWPNKMAAVFCENAVGAGGTTWPHAVRIEPKSDVASGPNPKNFTGRKLRRRQKVPLVAWG